MMRWILSSLSLLVGLTFAAEGAIAQVTADGSLSTPTSVTNSGLDYTVEGGSAVGSSLFHSFSQFSVPINGSALFENAATVRDIFARVTGGAISSIDGKLETKNPANLFLLNPSGIVFGANSSLDIGGSFVGTTAESIQFPEGVVFSATDASGVPLLSISTPTGLQMGQASGPITVQGTGHQITNDLPVVRNSTPTGLQAEVGQTLALIGSSVNFAGGVITTKDVSIPTPGGAISVSGGAHVEIGSLSQGEVSFDLTGAAVPWSYLEDTQFSDIHLAQQSLIDASGIMPGSIQLSGQNIDLADSSVLLLENFGSQTSNGISVHAVEALSMTGNTPNGTMGSLVLLESLVGGETGDLTVTAAQLLLQDGAKLRNQTFSPANGGNIFVNIQDSTVVKGAAPANPINSSNIGTTTAGSTGNAGNVELSIGSLTILDSGVVSSVTLGDGGAGQIMVTSRSIVESAGNNSVTLSPSGIASTAIGAGNAGTVTINTPVLSLRESAFVGSATLSVGSAGNVEINVSELVEVRGSAANSIAPSRIGSAAVIVDSATQAAFNLPEIPSGNSGSVKINTPSLRITEGAAVTARNDGPGTAGNIRIDADSIFLDERGGVSAIAQSGEGGNIFLESDVLLMRRGSSVNATAGGTGNGGNIDIDSPILIGLENSDIVANASQGDGGRIDITAQGIFGLAFRNQLTPENDITASSEFGVNGTVAINNLTVNPGASLVKLPDSLTNDDDQVAVACGTTSNNQFIASGRGGLPSSPSQALLSSRPWTDIRALDVTTGDTAPRTQNIPQRETVHPFEASEDFGAHTLQPPETPLIEASTWSRNEAGQLELIATLATDEITARAATCLTATS